MKLDYVTIGYWGDVRLLHLQARSMARYLDAGSVNAILVVNNDPERDRFRSYFDSLILPEYRDLASRVRLIDADDLLPASQTTKGYWRQQALKLLAYKMTETDCYITLDAKNLFIRPTTSSYFFDKTGRNICRHRLLRNHLRGGMRYFGLDIAQMPEAVMDIYTPFGLWRSVCRGLDEYLGRTSGMDIGQLLCSTSLFEGRPLYEYLLYSAYLHAHGGGIDTLHHLSHLPLSLTYLCNDPQVGPDALFAGVRNEKFSIIGVHRRVARADPATKSRFADLFQTFGLAATLEEGLHFLEATA